MQSVFERYGIDESRMESVPVRDRYVVDGRGLVDPDGIDGVRISQPGGRFGNNLRQISSAVKIAHKFGASTVAVPRMRPFRVTRPAQFESVQVVGIQPDHEFPGAWLVGQYIRMEAFRSLSATINDPALDIAVAESVLRDIFLQVVTPEVELEQSFEHAVVVHIRSGDLFSKATPHPSYVQPPLAYYTGAIAHAVSQGAREVVVVAEDRLNPCVDGVVEWCASQGLSCAMIGSDLKRTLATLYLAKTVVASKGSFYGEIFKLSPHPRRVYVSWLDSARYEPYRGAKAFDLQVGNDQFGGYISPKTWANSPEQLELMLRYPADAIVFAG